jgi:outer membrane protein TolC
MKKYIIILLLFPSIAFSQQVYDLKSCIERGLEYNYDIRIIKNTQQISDNNASIGNAGFLPTLDLTAGYSGNLDDKKRKLREGGGVERETGVFNQQLNAGIVLNYTIFDGFSVQTNYKKLKELQEIGELNTRMMIENFIAEISAEYYNYIQESLRLKNLKFAVELSGERLRIVGAGYSIGSMSKLDLQQARVDFNADSSKFVKQHELVFRSLVRLNQLMSQDEIEESIIAEDSILLSEILFEKEDLWEKTIENNTYLQLAEKEKNISSLELKSLQSRNYPYLKLNAGYGFNRNRYETSPDIYQNTLGLNYGLTLGFNLFNGFNRSREQQNAKIAVENKKLEFQQIELSVKSDFANILMAYYNNQNILQLELENRQHAMENYEIAMERYKLGDLSGIELREAQNSLLDAEDRLVTAQYNTKLCEISLLQISGQIAMYLE